MAEPPPALGRRASQSGRRFEAGRDPKHRTTDAARGPSRAGGASTPSHHPRKERRIEGAGVPLDGPSLRGHWGGRPPRGVARGHRVPASSSSREGCLSGAMVFAVGRSHVTWARPAGLATRHGEPSRRQQTPSAACTAYEGPREASRPRCQREATSHDPSGSGQRSARTARDPRPPTRAQPAAGPHRLSGPRTSIVPQLWNGACGSGSPVKFFADGGRGPCGLRSPGGKAVPRTAVPS